MLNKEKLGDVVKDDNAVVLAIGEDVLGTVKEALGVDLLVHHDEEKERYKFSIVRTRE
jgi:hypothetical protein